MSAVVPIQPETPTEQWSVVPGYPAYEVSNLGRVRRCTTVRGANAGHILRPASTQSGHRFVMLTDPAGLARKQFVHRLVARAFIGPSPFIGALVLHHDDIPDNNTPENLYWGTHAENVADARLNRRPRDQKRNRGAQPGEENSSAVLTEDQVRRIKGLLGLGMCGACIARLHGVRKETVYAIAKGRTWGHVTEEASPWIG